MAAGRRHRAWVLTEFVWKVYELIDRERRGYPAAGLHHVERGCITWSGAASRGAGLHHVGAGLHYVGAGPHRADASPGTGLHYLETGAALPGTGAARRGRWAAVRSCQP